VAACVGGPRRRPVRRAGDGLAAGTEAREDGGEGRPLEARGPHVERLDELALKDLDELAGRLAAGAERRHPPHLLHLTPTRRRDLAVTTSAHDELADR